MGRPTPSTPPDSPTAARTKRLRDGQMRIHGHLIRMDKPAPGAAKTQWSHRRAPVSRKSHSELKRTSSIGYGTHQPSAPRGDGNVTFFGSEAPKSTRRR